MHVESEADRLALDERLEARLGGGLGPNTRIAELLRRSLAVLPSQELAGLWFRSGAGNPPEACIDEFIRACRERLRAKDPEEETQANNRSSISSDDIRAALAQLLTKSIATGRDLITRRSILFAWVYGPSPATRDLVHVRLPCRERQKLVDLVLVALRPRYPWLTSRQIYAMTFRPAAFRAMRSAPNGQRAWGPLYRRVVIQQGRKRRFLWIPNRVLKAVQKTLLKLLQPTVDQAIGSNVFGARRGIVGPTFANAAVHMHRSMIASFDIKDFFPSTSVADVIHGLQHLNRQSPLAIDPSRPWSYPAFIAHEKHLKLTKWTDAVRVFVARAGTYRGRLPQGSPLSPLLANVAFAPYDDALVKALDQQFGKGRIKYTRYFDDITISSLSPPGAGAGMTPDAFRKVCEENIARVLSGSSYLLNEHKSRCSTSAEGHVVTGVMVRRNSLTLPRRQRRQLRTVSHALRRQDFVQTAYRWRQLAGRPEVSFESIRLGHRFAEGTLRARRMSAERLATLMLQRIYPDLKLHRMLTDWHPWQERFDSAEDRVSGKKMWPLIEWILAALWSGAIRPYRLTDDCGQLITNRIVIRQDETEVCVLAAESTLEFFFLGRDRAIAAVEYWHHLRGLSAYLNGCPEGEPFGRIKFFGESLREACAMIEVRSMPDEPTPVEEAVVTPPVTSSEYFERLTADFDAALRDHISFARVLPGQGFGEARDVFRRQRATTWQEMQKWLHAAAALTTGLCPVLPIGPVPDDHIPPVELYEYLRCRFSIDHNLVSDDYRCVRRFEQKFKIGPQTPATHLGRIQSRIAESLLISFRAIQRNTAREEINHTFENHLHGAIEDRIRDQLNLFEELHRKARSDDSERRLLRSDTWHDVAELRDTLQQELARELPSTQVWLHLELVAKRMYLAIVEALEDVLCTDKPPETELFPEAWRRRRLWGQSQTLVAKADRLKLLDKLRNRASHGRSPERRPEWVGIQSRVAELLGREWKSECGKNYPEYSAPDDLVLTSHESQIIKMELLLSVNEWLKRIVDVQWWRRRTVVE